MIDIDALKKEFLNLEFATREFTINGEKAANAARLVGATAPQWTDPNHADFQVHPAFLASLAAGRHLPINFPKLGGLPMDGGKAVACAEPVPAGQPLTGRTHLHDIYDKSGRSGRMVFLVSRMEIFNAAGTLLATNDSRMVVRERSSS